ncbi:hypothetical protein ABZX85_42375 [Streptomyces sp. NPDC004539]|uniref:hypothetical protein n=1 Tax=Streptomyces sp. NPDC004539 TaxID=3154280 RepID=UPI0033A97C36
MTTGTAARELVRRSGRARTRFGGHGVTFLFLDGVRHGSPPGSQVRVMAGDADPPKPECPPAVPVTPAELAGPGDGVAGTRCDVAVVPGRRVR